MQQVQFKPTRFVFGPARALKQVDADRRRVTLQIYLANRTVTEEEEYDEFLSCWLSVAYGLQTALKELCMTRLDNALTYYEHVCLWETYKLQMRVAMGESSTT